MLNIPLRKLVSSKWLVINVIIMIIVLLVTYNYLTQDKPIYIAVAGPLSQESGQQMVNGVQFYLDKINREGGINGKTAKLIQFDDQANPNVAKAIA